MMNDKFDYYNTFITLKIILPFEIGGYRNDEETNL